MNEKLFFIHPLPGGSSLPRNPANVLESEKVSSIFAGGSGGGGSHPRKILLLPYRGVFFSAGKALAGY